MNDSRSTRPHGVGRRAAAAVTAMLAALFLTGGVALLAASTAQATSAGSHDNDQVCSGLDSGKIDVSGDKISITVTAPDGMLISAYCVKAGSTNAGDGPHYVTLASPQKTVTLTYTDSDGKAKALSHYSLSYVPTSSGGGGSSDTEVTPSVQFHNPSCAEMEASWAGFVDGDADSAGDGVVFAVTSGTAAPGESVTVTATAQAGFVFAGGVTTKTFMHTFAEVPTDCSSGGGVVEVTPTVQFHNPDCTDMTASWAGFVNGVADAAGDGVTFAVTSGSVAPGATVTVTATAETGFEFVSSTTTKTFTHTFTAAPTDCSSVSPPTGGTPPAGATPPTVTSPGVTVSGPQTVGSTGAGTGSGTVPTVVEAGLSHAATGEQALQTLLGRGMVAAGLVLLLTSTWLGRRRRGGAFRA